MSKRLTLPQYLDQLGDEAASILFGVKPRTILSWRRGDRIPRPKQARVIVKKSPLTMEDIYGQ